jgi:hypothetical protein
MNQTVHHLQMLMQGKILFFPSVFSNFFSCLFSSVMYRKYKENKDNEYETIIKKQVNESRLIAEQEGITIPKTLDDYVAPSRAGALGLNNGKNGKKSAYNTLSHEDDVDLGIDVRFCFSFFNENLLYI